MLPAPATTGNFAAPPEDFGALGLEEELAGVEAFVEDPGVAETGVGKEETEVAELPAESEAAEAEEVELAEEAEPPDVAEPDEATVNCWDWARMPVFFGSVDSRLNW